MTCAVVKNTFETLRRLSDDTQRKVRSLPPHNTILSIRTQMIALSSEIGKLEFSLDVLDSLDQTQRDLQLVMDTFQNNYEGLNSDPSQRDSNSESDRLISQALQVLFVNAAESFKGLEMLLELRRSRKPNSVLSRVEQV